MQETVVKNRSQKNIWMICLFVFVALVLIIEGTVELVRGSLLDSDTNANTSATTSILPAPKVPTGAGVPTALNMGMAGAPTSVTSLQEPQSVLAQAHEKDFTLTAQPASFHLGAGPV